MNKDILVKLGFFASGIAVGSGITYIVMTRSEENGFYDDLDEIVDDISDGVNEIVDDRYFTYNTVPGIDEKPLLDEVIRKSRERRHDTDEDSEKEMENMPKFVGAISEKEYTNSEDGLESMTGTYFKKDGILVGFNDDFEEIEESEIGEDAWEYVSESTSPVVYFKNEDDGRKYEIIISEDSYDEAYEEFVQKEVDNAIKEGD